MRKSNNHHTPCEKFSSSAVVPTKGWSKLHTSSSCPNTTEKHTTMHSDRSNPVFMFQSTFRSNQIVARRSMDALQTNTRVLAARLSCLPIFLLGLQIGTTLVELRCQRAFKTTQRTLVTGRVLMLHGMVCTVVFLSWRVHVTSLF